MQWEDHKLRCKKEYFNMLQLHVLRDEHYTTYVRVRRSNPEKLKQGLG